MTTKISVYSLGDLKSTIDDHIPLYLTSPNLGPLSVPLARSLRFKETHFYTTVRLALGYSSVALILYIFYLDYYLKLPWSEHKLVTAWAVLGYVILSGAMSIWIWRYERGIIFEGSRTNGPSVSVRIYSLSPPQKYEPVYRLRVEWTKKGVEESRDLSSPFTSFFQRDGTFVSGEFERWIKSKLPEILDGSAASVKTTKAVSTGASLDETEKMAATEKIAENSTTGADAVHHKESGKRRHKKNN